MAPEVPRDLPSLRRFVAERAGPSPHLEVPAAPQAFASTDLPGIAGASACGLPEALVRVAGAPSRLFSATPAALGEERLRQGEAHLVSGRHPEARAAFSAALWHERAARPWPEVRIGDSYAVEERWSEALAVYGPLLERFPWSPAPRVGRGRALRALGRRLDATDELGRALALSPGRRDLERELGDDFLAFVRAPLAPPAAREASGRWVMRARMGASPQQLEVEASAYASCKEGFRSSLALRMAATGEPSQTWLWSPAEESICTAVWLAAYLEHRAAGRSADDDLDAVADAAQRGWMDARSLYDVGARVHPHAPALLTAAAREALFAFVAQHRAGRKPDTQFLFP